MGKELDQQRRREPLKTGASRSERLDALIRGTSAVSVQEPSATPAPAPATPAAPSSRMTRLDAILGGSTSAVAETKASRVQETPKPGVDLSSLQGIDYQMPQGPQIADPQALAPGALDAAQRSQALHGADTEKPFAPGLAQLVNDISLVNQASKSLEAEDTSKSWKEIGKETLNRAKVAGKTIRSLGGLTGDLIPFEKLPSAVQTFLNYNPGTWGITTTSEQLGEEANKLSGFGPATVPATAETVTSALEWAYLYPAAFKGAEKIVAGAGKIPLVKQAGQYIESLGGVKWVAEHYPRIYQGVKSAMHAAEAGAIVGAAKGGVEAVAEDMEIGEGLEHTAKEAGTFGLVSGVFSAASDIDKTRYVGRLREAMLRKFDADLRGKIAQTKTAAEVKGLRGYRDNALRNIDSIVSAVEADLRGMTQSDLYKNIGSKIEAPEKAADRFLKYGYEPAKAARIEGVEALKEGYGQRPKGDIIDLPATRTEEVIEAVKNPVKTVKAAIQQIRESAPRPSAQSVTPKPPTARTAPIASKKGELPPTAAPVMQSPAAPAVQSKSVNASPAPALNKEYQAIEVPVSELVLSKEVPNFKEGASLQTGVVSGQELQGTYNRLGTAPILVWERTDGTKEVITGRHRLDLAKRTGEKSIPAQVVRESERFTRQMALTFDAESNIRDGQGTVKDYAHYFKNSRITEEEARQRGLLSRVKGNVGFRMGKSAADDIYAAFTAGKLSESKAYAIANGAPGNESAQLAAAAKASTFSADELEQYARILARSQPSDLQKTTQGNLFGFDDSALIEAEAVAKEVGKEQKAISERILAVKGALKRPEAARTMGLKFSDEESVRNEVARLEDRLDQLSRTATTPELYDEMRRRAGLASMPAINVSSKPVDLLDRPVLEGGTSGQQKEMLDKDNFKTISEQERINAKDDVAGQMDFLGGVKAEAKPAFENKPKPEDRTGDLFDANQEPERAAILRQLEIDPDTVTIADAERIAKDYQDGINAESLPKVPLESKRLPGGKHAGGTTILSDVAAEIVGLGHKAINSPVQLGKSAVKMAVRNIKAGNNHIRTLGNAGRRTAEELDSIVFRATKAANIDNDDIRQIYKGLSKSQRETIAKIVNGRIDASTQKPALVERAKKLREVLDRSMNEAANVGMYRIVDGKKISVGGSGKAFPQIPNAAGIRFLNEAEEKGLSSDRVFAWATDQVKDGKLENVDQAVSMLQMFRQNRLRGVNRYLESTRVELPEEFVEWDGAKILSCLLEKNWLAVEGVRAWGNNFNLINSRAEQIAARYGRKEAERVKLFIKTSFSVISPASTESQKISDVIRGYQFNTKVGLSPLTILRNMTDRIAKSLTLTTNFAINLSTAVKYPPFINQFIRSSQRLERDMIRRGAVFGHGSLSEGYEAGSFFSDIAGHPFSASERGNQIQIAITKYLQLKRDLATLEKRGGKDAISTKIANALKIPFQDATKYRIAEHGGEQLLDKALAGEAIPDDLINEVLHRTVRDKAFPMVISTKPLWYDNHPMVKVLAQFKTWPMKQTAMIWNDVVKYTVKTGDGSRLAGFLLGTLIAGEIYNILRDFLYDKDESIMSKLISGGDGKDVAKAALGDLLDGGVVGMLADFTYGVYDWVTGVSFNTAANVKEAATAIYKRPKMTLPTLNRLVQKEVTPVRQMMKLVDKIDRNFINKKNVTKDFFRVRDWAWEYRNNYEAPGLKDKAEQIADDLIYGKTQYKPGDNTLSYQMASRQLQVGDIADAACFFNDILEHGGKVSDIKRTMFTWYSPYGHINELEPDFLRNLPARKREIAVETYEQWEKNYYAAMSKALEKRK
ncbi:MAG: hypothetical protein LLF76_04665 [Planctomycetaceae bacterium]|nr:hypothetical protein [Planctomycetaceae bacterium]